MYIVSCHNYMCYFLEPITFYICSLNVENVGECCKAQ